jgi:hypothetical protein
VGKHSASDLGSSPGTDTERTRELFSVPRPDRRHSTLSVRIAVLGGLVATVLLSGLLWLVNHRSEPDLTAIPVEAPTLHSLSADLVDPTVPVSAGASTAVSPSAPNSASAVPGASGGPNQGAVPTRGPDASPTVPVFAGAPATSRPVTRPPTTAGTPTSGSATLTARFEMTNSRYGGYQAQYTITNRSSAAVHGWMVVVTFSGSGNISVWNANPDTGSNHRVTFRAESYNSTVPANGSVTFGLNVTGSPAPTPTACTVNGQHC